MVPKDFFHPETQKNMINQLMLQSGPVIGWYVFEIDTTLNFQQGSIRQIINKNLKL